MEIIADVWLLDLALESYAAKEVAAVLLRTQIRTQRNTGHVLDFSQELVRRSLGAQARRGNIWRGYCRCLRCGALALLPKWIEAAGLAADVRALAVEATPQSQAASVRYLAKCGWRERMKEADLLLEINLQEEVQ